MQIPTEIGGVLIGPLVAGLIEALKAAGVPVRYAPWLNIALSTAFVVVAQAFAVYPEAQGWIVAVLQIVVAVLTAAGFYQEAIKRVRRRD